MIKFIFTLYISLLASFAHAEDRALIMGIRHYQNPEYDLIGVDEDVKTMQETARLMGFQSIKVLENEQVTKENIEDTMKSWLIKGLTPKDRVLIYFSGHGSLIPDRSGDETDGSDEVLVMYDVNVVKKKSSPTTLGGVFIDDDLNELLNQIPSHNILVLLDSCHSGTATRSLNKEMMSKAFSYEGMPKPVKKTRTLSKKTSALQKSTILTISAADDTEESLSDSKGGLFTTGLHNALDEAIAQKKPITPLEIKAKVDAAIQKRLKGSLYGYKTFHPQVSGDAALINQPFILVGVNDNQVNDVVAPDTQPVPVTPIAPVVMDEQIQQPKIESTWDSLVKLVKPARPLTIKTNKSTFVENENLTIQVNLKESGYLNVITVDANNVATLLFPNQYQPDNSVTAGNFTFPTAQMNFNLTTQAPFGKTLIVAVLSQEKLNLYNATAATTTPVFRDISLSDIQQLQEKISHTTRVGKVEIVSCQSLANCR